MNHNPVTLTLTPELARLLYETLKFYADVTTYQAHTEFVDALTMRPPRTTIPTPEGLTDPAQKALDAWNETRARANEATR